MNPNIMYGGGDIVIYYYVITDKPEEPGLQDAIGKTINDKCVKNIITVEADEISSFLISKKVDMSKVYVYKTTINLGGFGFRDMLEHSKTSLKNQTELKLDEKLSADLDGVFVFCIRHRSVTKSSAKIKIKRRAKAMKKRTPAASAPTSTPSPAAIPDAMVNGQTYRGGADRRELVEDNVAQPKFPWLIIRKDPVTNRLFAVDVNSEYDHSSDTLRTVIERLSPEIAFTVDQVTGQIINEAEPIVVPIGDMDFYQIAGFTNQLLERTFRADYPEYADLLQVWGTRLLGHNRYIKKISSIYTKAHSSFGYENPAGNQQTKNRNSEEYYDYQAKQVRTGYHNLLTNLAEKQLSKIFIAESLPELQEQVQRWSATLLTSMRTDRYADKTDNEIEAELERQNQRDTLAQFRYARENEIADGLPTYPNCIYFTEPDVPIVRPQAIGQDEMYYLIRNSGAGDCLFIATAVNKYYVGIREALSDFPKRIEIRKEANIAREQLTDDPDLTSDLTELEYETANGEIKANMHNYALKLREKAVKWLREHKDEYYKANTNDYPTRVRDQAVKVAYQNANEGRNEYGTTRGLNNYKRDHLADYNTIKSTLFPDLAEADELTARHLRNIGDIDDYRISYILEYNRVYPLLNNLYDDLFSAYLVAISNYNTYATDVEAMALSNSLNCSIVIVGDSFQCTADHDKQLMPQFHPKTVMDDPTQYDHSRTLYIVNHNNGHYDNMLPMEMNASNVAQVLVENPPTPTPTPSVSSADSSAASTPTPSVSSADSSTAPTPPAVSASASSELIRDVNVEVDLDSFTAKTFDIFEGKPDTYDDFDGTVDCLQKVAEILRYKIMNNSSADRNDILCSVPDRANMSVYLYNRFIQDYRSYNAEQLHDIKEWLIIANLMRSNWSDIKQINITEEVKLKFLFEQIKDRNFYELFSALDEDKFRVIKEDTRITLEQRVEDLRTFEQRVDNFIRANMLLQSTSLSKDLKENTDLTVRDVFYKFFREREDLVDSYKDIFVPGEAAENEYTDKPEIDMYIIVEKLMHQLYIEIDFVDTTAAAENVWHILVEDQPQYSQFYLIGSIYATMPKIQSAGDGTPIPTPTHSLAKLEIALRDYGIAVEPKDSYVCHFHGVGDSNVAVNYCLDYDKILKHFLDLASFKGATRGLMKDIADYIDAIKGRMDKIGVARENGRRVVKADFHQLLVIVIEGVIRISGIIDKHSLNTPNEEEKKFLELLINFGSLKNKMLTNWFMSMFVFVIQRSIHMLKSDTSDPVQQSAVLMLVDFQDQIADQFNKFMGLKLLIDLPAVPK